MWEWRGPTTACFSLCIGAELTQHTKCELCGVPQEVSLIPINVTF